MAVSKIGTNALSSGLDVSSTNISYTGTLTGGTGVVNIGSGQVYKDSSGNVGIGATSIPSGYKLLVGSSSTNAGIELFKSGSGAQGGYLNLRPSLAAGNEYNLSISAYDHSGDNNTDGISINAFDGISFCTGSNTRQERARIDSSGNLLVGTTTVNAARVSVVNAAGGASISAAQTNSTGDHIYFRTSTTTLAGYITSPTSTTCNYASVSDYRLKEDVKPMVGALAKVAALKPVTYKWKTDGLDGQGFIAHELQEVVPDCVTGEKDAVDAEGNPVYQGIDTSFLVATLTAAIQELKAELDSVKAELAVLKGV